jgi:hypothetical protein
MPVDDKYYESDYFEQHTQEIEIRPSTIETIDRALLEYLEGLDIHAQSNKGWQPVPIIWAGAERAFQIKNEQNLRDVKGVLKLPMILIERTSIVKDLNKKGSIQGLGAPRGDYKNANITIARVINQDKTANFVNAEAKKLTGPRGKRNVGHGQLNFPGKTKKVVYKSVSIPIPLYLELNYKLVLKTEYQQQMNEIIMPFMVSSGPINYKVLSKDNHKYEAFFESDYAIENNIASLGDEERSYNTTINVRVLGHIIGSGKNQDTPKIVHRENAVEVTFPREHVMLGDTPEHGRISGSADPFYRE